MSTRRSFDHIGSFNFKVEIDGLQSGTFIDVSNLESSTEVVEFRDGNGVTTRKIPGKSSSSNITLRRGYTDNHELWHWRRTVIQGQVQRKNISVVVCDDDNSEIMRFNFYEAWPCRYALCNLGSAENRTLVEEIELVVEGIEMG